MFPIKEYLFTVSSTLIVFLDFNAENIFFTLSPIVVSNLFTILAVSFAIVSLLTSSTLYIPTLESLLVLTFLTKSPFPEVLKFNVLVQPGTVTSKLISSPPKISKPSGTLLTSTTAKVNFAVTVGDKISS